MSGSLDGGLRHKLDEFGYKTVQNDYASGLHCGLLRVILLGDFIYPLCADDTARSVSRWLFRVLASPFLSGRPVFQVICHRDDTQYKGCQLDTSGLHSLKFTLTTSHTHNINANHQAHHHHLHTRHNFCFCYSYSPRSWNKR
jgi:hypothetical protein